MPLEQRFWEKVEKTDSCWIWRGCRTSSGYGKISIGDGRTRGAHRVAYELMVGAIPDGHQIHHRCENPSCVNPAHLEPVTRIRHASRHRKTRCKYGHRFDAKNTRVTPSGRRRCRTCDRRLSRSWSITKRKNETPEQRSARQRANANKRWHPELAC